jgi:gamma-glutamyltranspeptidase/glutathione hydrolase
MADIALLEPAHERTTPPSRKRRCWLSAALTVLAVLLLLAALVAGLGYRVSRRFTASEPYPETATGLRTVEALVARDALVVAADPQAARAAHAMLARGGSALDAALAAQLVLGLVEPQSSGLGGGAFMMYWDADRSELHAYDGRETAPTAADANLFMRAGEPLSFPRALVGGRSVGVPGALRMLALAHAEHGRLPWRDAFVDATHLARSGFEVSARLSKLLALDPILPTLAPARATLLTAEGRAPGPGIHLTNRAYANTLEAIAQHGADVLYEGPIANEVARAVREARQPSMLRGVWNLLLGELGMAMGGSAETSAPGTLSARDLSAYRPLAHAALCRPYRSWRVCGMPPPASGLTVLEALALLERFDLGRHAPRSPEALHLLAEAQRVAFADRDTWLADPAFSDVPVNGLLAPDYTTARSRPITLERALGTQQPGTPPGAHTLFSPARAPELPATSHFSIVDRRGNVATMTSSIEFAFGSHTLVDGFLLNNQLTDFSFRPVVKGRPVANAIAPGKRPRSAMSPIMVFDAQTDQPVAALGSPGGPAIPGYVLQTLVALLDWKLTPQQAVALPHVVQRNREKTELEDVGWTSPAERDAAVRGLEARGHRVELGSQNSGLHVIGWSEGKLLAGVDPRRAGSAVGD